MDRKMDRKEIFLLTKPPHSQRTDLCLRLLERSMNAVLYLAGDGVYNLLESSNLKFPSGVMVWACQEDLLARGIQSVEGANVPDDFYRRLVEDMASDDSFIYVF